MARPPYRVWAGIYVLGPHSFWGYAFLGYAFLGYTGLENTGFIGDQRVYNVGHHVCGDSRTWMRASKWRCPRLNGEVDEPKQSIFRDAGEFG